MVIEYRGEKITFDPDSRRFKWAGKKAASIARIEKLIDDERAATTMQMPVLLIETNDEGIDEVVRGTVVAIVNHTGRKGYVWSTARVQTAGKNGKTLSGEMQWDRLYVDSPENLELATRYTALQKQIDEMEEEIEHIRRQLVEVPAP